MNSPRSAELIAIGDELLIGLRQNSHLTWLGALLAEQGLPLRWASEVRDDPADLIAAIQQALQRADLVLLTGGLGPTSDDCTVQSLGEALQIPLRHDESVEAHIRDFFAQRNREPTSNNFKQCLVLKDAEVLSNPNGTAPGQFIRLPSQRIAVLPGPPRELQPMVEDRLLPALKNDQWLNTDAQPVRFRCVGIGESAIAERLEPLVQPYANQIQIAYCAHLSYVDVRLHPLTTRQQPPPTETDLQQLAERCRESLGEAFLGYGSPELACLILRQLRSLNKSLAVAESCTGGLLASRFTDVPGASKVFKGGLICYKNEIKENLLGVPASLLRQHGAVSAECAVAMATGIAEFMEVDYALAITGYAGPDGGPNEPAGTVYLGYHSPTGVWSRKTVLPGNRSAVKERAVIHALDFLRLKLEKYKIHDLLESLRC